MSVALWCATALLVGIFTASGLMKSTMSMQRMVETGQTGVAPFPLPVVRVVAVTELLAVAGLLAPWLTGIAPWLTPAAALWLAVVMCGAAVAHASLTEPKAVAANLVLLGAAVFVAAGRIAQLA